MLVTVPGVQHTSNGLASEIVLDAEFHSLMPEPLPDERALIKAALFKDGCLEPLVVWRCGPRFTLLTGYDIFPTVREWGLSFRVVIKEFDSRQQARFFVIQDQLARRNPGTLLISYLRGLHYCDERQKPGGDRRSPRVHRHGRTAAVLAEMFHVSPATIERDGAVADALTEIAANCGDEWRRRLLRRDAGLGRGGLLALAKLPADQQLHVLMAWRISGRWPRGWREDDRPATVTLPAEPAACVAALLRRLGPEFARAVHQLLGEKLSGTEVSPDGCGE